MKKYKHNMNVTIHFFRSAWRIKRLLLCMLVLLTAGCKEKFDSPVPPVASGYLVVEGIVNNDGDSTNIRLSRTISLGDNVKRYESGASVQIEDNNNNSLYLVENGIAGNYTINNIHLDTALRYRLVIKTNKGEEFQSDFVAVKNNPPIDSLHWVRDEKGVKVFINTHDPQNNTRYYQWEYNETWEFHTLYSDCKYIYPADPNEPFCVHRDASDPQIFKCWKFNASNTILLGSSAKLADDIIHLPIIFHANGVEKLSVLYSVNVKQYAWSKEGYDFLTRMKKNTESIGSIFDAQPSELNTNFHCITNPNQPVIGFFNICTIREKRIFIGNKDLPKWGYKLPCNQIEVTNTTDGIKMAGAVYMLPTISVQEIFTIEIFNASSSTCVDCRLTGTNVKPDYWP